MIRARLYPFLALSFLALLNLSGCGFAINRFTAKEDVTKTLRTQTMPHVMVETFNGSIEVLTGDDGKVKATVTKHASGKSQEDAEEDLDNIEVTIGEDKDGIHVVAVPQDHNAFRNRGASVVLEVPAGAILDLTTSNGKIAAAGEVGDVTADSSNGSIQVEGSKGKVRLHTSNGGITVKGESPKLNVKTSNGPITITAHKALVEAQTSNGSIHFDGTLAEGDHSFRSSNGKLLLELPAGSSFKLDAQTSNGKVSCDFAVEGGKSGQKELVRGTVGNHADKTIKLTTSNSNIEIRKK